MIRIINRPPNDRFTHDLFHSLLAQLDCRYEAWYLWPSADDSYWRLLENTDFSQCRNVILGIKDHLEYQHGHGAQILNQLAQRFPQTNFVVLTSCENFHDDPPLCDNLHVIPWGGDITNQLTEYQYLEPVLDKDLQSQRCYISLNHHLRPHRVFLASYLYGCGLAHKGHISMMRIDQLPDPAEFDGWFCMPRHADHRQFFYRGFNMISQYHDHAMPCHDPYHGLAPNDNVANFNLNLRPLYQKSFVEFVTETTFSHPSYLLTEKTRHAFMACNFPIILSGQGAVAHLRTLGLDLFDDVINHDYDHVSNPTDRIIMAVELNRGLLTQVDAVKQAWLIHRERFLHNHRVLAGLGDQYRQRAQCLWDQVPWNQ